MNKNKNFNPKIKVGFIGVEWWPVILIAPSLDEAEWEVELTEKEYQQIKNATKRFIELHNKIEDLIDKKIKRKIVSNVGDYYHDFF